MPIDITYSKRTTQSAIRIWDLHFPTLPEPCQQYILQFKRHKDRLDRLIGRLLVRNALIRKGFPNDCLQHIHLDKNTRPYLNKNIDFNISHSGGIIICAVAENCRVGIDIEKITTIKFSNYADFLSPQQLQEIDSSKDPYGKFFEFWTIQESLLKADGRGLTLDHKIIDLQPGRCSLDDHHYYYHKLNIAPDYSSHLSANTKIQHLTISEKIL